jgi:N-acetylmuramoyl-L-alanine amidase
MRIALMIGHHENAQGAESPHLNTSEWAFYNEMVEYFKQMHTKHDYFIFRHNPSIKGYHARLSATAREINRVRVDLVISLHFNSATASANGTETFYFHSSRKGKELAQKLNDHTVAWLDTRNRGIKPLQSKSDRGFGSVVYTDAPTVLWEPFFGSNKNDCEKAMSPNYIAQVLNDFLSCEI